MKKYVTFWISRLAIIPTFLTSIFLLSADASPYSKPNLSKISPEVAIKNALSWVKANGNSAEIGHYRLTINVNKDSASFKAKSGINWKWSLKEVRAKGGKVSFPATADSVPVIDENKREVWLSRGFLNEGYVAKEKTIEQLFHIPKKLDLEGRDLEILGNVTSNGRFTSENKGWKWKNTTGEISLGDVLVLDSSGNTLPAKMQVTQNSTLITIDGKALDRANYPVIVDPEVGTNDIRISDVGPDGDTSYGVNPPSVAYNSTNNEFLVTWAGDDNVSPLVDNEFECLGQRINAATGAEVGTNDFRISDMGPDGNTAYSANNCIVSYNITNNEYLVVWDGDDNSGALVDNKREIYGQRLNAATGAEVGTNDFRITTTGGDGDVLINATSPAITYNSTDNEYLIIYTADPETGGLAADETEVFGQRLNAATGALVGASGFRISDMGPDGDTLYGVASKSVVYNNTTNEYLVVWTGDDNTGSLVNNEFEVFGQRLSASGTETGTNDFRISDMGPDGNASFNALVPRVAYNSISQQYLVSWIGDDNTAPLVDGELEVYVQRLSGATGSELGTNDQRISDVGGLGNTTYNVNTQRVSFNSIDNEYLVVWVANDDTAGLDPQEVEIYAQRLNGETGEELGSSDFRLSDMGPDGVSTYAADSPALAYNNTNNSFLVVWRADDQSATTVDEELEIWGQRFVSTASDLSIVTTAAPALILPGGTLTMSLAVSNAGIDTASRITVTDELAAELTYVSASGSGWTCSHANQIVTCYRDSLTVGDAPTITITATLAENASAGTLNNSASVSTLSFDQNSSNDLSTSSTTITTPTATPNPQPNLTASLSSVKRNDLNVSGKATCSNAGQADSSTFNLRIYLSKNNEFDSKDSLVAQKSITSLAQGADSKALSFKKTYKKSPKRKYIIAICDSTNLVTESSETDNTASQRLK